MDNTDLVMEAQELRNAVVGLELFATDHFGTQEVTLKDIDGLRGLIASIKLMAVSHMENATNQSVTTID